MTLFVRGKRNISLTEEGIFLKQQAEEIIGLLEKNTESVGKDKTSTHGTISLGVTETCGASTPRRWWTPFTGSIPTSATTSGAETGRGAREAGEGAWWTWGWSGNRSTPSPTTGFS